MIDQQMKKPARFSRKSRILFTWAACLLLICPGACPSSAFAQLQNLVEQRIKQKAEEEAKQKAEQEAEKAAQEAVQKAAQDAARKAAQEAERKAAQEAQQRAAQEAQQRAAQEAQQKAAQEADRPRPGYGPGGGPVLKPRPIDEGPLRPSPPDHAPGRIPDRPPVSPDRPIYDPNHPPLTPLRPGLPGSGRLPRPAPVDHPGRPVVPTGMHPPGAHPLPSRLPDHPVRPGDPHPIPHPVPDRPARPVLPVRPPYLAKLPPPRPRPVVPEPVITARPPVVVVGRPGPRVVIQAPAEVVLPALPRPSGQIVVSAGAPYPPPAIVVTPYAAAQTQLQQAQAGCAQADAYQNYVNQVVNSQANTSADTDQILQTLANNTSDPDLQNALLSAVGQPNPINDTLDQQLEDQASVYESTCQTRLAAAQAAMPPDPSQQAASAVPAPSAAAQMPALQGDPASYQFGKSFGPAAAAGDGQDPQSAEPQPATPGGSCPAASPGNLPSPGTWGPWTPLGNSGLVFDVSRVNGTTLTWRFLNAGPSTVMAMNFNYSYVDANTGQPTTLSDLLPFALAPGQSVGGWTAYTANTRDNNLSLTITQISCQ